MKKLLKKDFISKALPIIVVTLVTMVQAIADQKESDKIEEMEQRIKELESNKEGA